MQRLPRLNMPIASHLHGIHHGGRDFFRREDGPLKAAGGRGFIGRVNDDATRNKRNSMGSRDSGYNVRLSINSCCAGLGVKQSLF
jgi:hypothetical protein